MSVGGVPMALRAFLDVQTTRAKLYSRFHDGFKSFLQTKQEGPYQALMAELTVAFSNCSREVIALETSLKDLGRPDLAAMLREVQESEREKLRLTLALQALRQAAVFRTFSWQQRGGADGGAAGNAADEHDDDEALALLDPHFAASRQHHRHGHAHGHARGQDGASSHGHILSNDKSAHGDEQAGDNRHDANWHGHGQHAELAGPGEVVTASGSADGAPSSNGCLPGAVGDAVGGVVAEAAERSSSDGCGAVEGSGGGHVHGAGCGCGHSGAGGPAEPTRTEYEAAVKEAMQELDCHVRKINDIIGDVRMELEDD